MPPEHTFSLAHLGVVLSDIALAARTVADSEGLAGYRLRQAGQLGNGGFEAGCNLEDFASYMAYQG